MKRLVSSRLFALTLLAVALAVRMAVPQGWMPAPAGATALLMPCPGAAPAMPHAMAAHHGQNHEDHGREQPCAYSVASLAIDHPAVPAIEAPAALFVAAPAPIARVAAVGRGLAAPPPPAIGPPVFL